ncbi:MAG TPA: prolipoprotein diacylglyceryl transferase [Bacteroidota bacterium]|nr:prolipoprotein diacylglyceryl transferase [Bacteroidota bacterium]
MYPRLFHIGPFDFGPFHIGTITVYGYGLMLAVGFIIASYVLANEFKRRKLDPNFANNITIIALLAGVAGSKILYLIENLNEFLADPFGMTFSPGGLTFYGGFILATLCIYFYGKKKKLGFFLMGDAIAPALMLGYGIARVGCHLAGDGDYGFPTSLPWGTDYANGTYPPSIAFRDFPEVTGKFPGGIVPDHTLCHPTPIYELIICVVMFFILWRLRKNIQPVGKLFMLYLVLAGLERFSIEFLRINQRLLFGLSEAQLIAIVLIAVGSIGWWKFSRQTAQPSQ